MVTVVQEVTNHSRGTDNPDTPIAVLHERHGRLSPQCHGTVAPSSRVSGVITAFDTAGHSVRPVISPERPEIKSLYRVYRRQDVNVKNATTGDVARLEQRLEIGFSNTLPPSPPPTLLPSQPRGRAVHREVERNKFSIFQTKRAEQNELPVSK
jgi:hypothetical protein